MKLKKLDVASLSQRVGLNDGVLVLRPMAKKMFEASRSEVGDLTSDEVLICDLQKIFDCSSSFVDEFVLAWQRVVCELKNTMMILINMNEDVQYTVEAALNQRNRISNESLSLIAYFEDRFTVLGNKLEKNTLQVFELVADGAHITAREVAERFDLELNSAGNRLKKLYDAHAVMRAEQSADAGGKFEYFIPVIK